jgi:hypothetical protein
MLHLIVVRSCCCSLLGVVVRWHSFISIASQIVLAASNSIAAEVTAKHDVDINHSVQQLSNW